ncbi:hypothetical protein [Pseudomonas lactis]|uniref:hypothetical protein n=1 Tax=Pseudomonas lactis TaxID=1615674 RepID=UPI003F807A3B
MLPMDAKRNPDSYSYPNGMFNSGYIAGVLRKPDLVAGTCFIQQTRSENHMLPVHFDPKKSPIPRDITDGSLVMAYAHVEGATIDGQRIARLKSIRFEAPNFMHLGPRFHADLMQKWGAKVHEQAVDTGIPPAISALGEVPTAESAVRRDAFDWKALDLNKNSANHVKIAGFVQAKSLERNRIHADGQPMNDKLVVLLRQTADSSKCIPIRWYGRNLQPLADILQRGMPIVVSGEFRLDVKQIGEPSADQLIAPVSKIPYIQAKDMPGPVQPDSELIKMIPTWVTELYNQFGTQDQSAQPADDERSSLFEKAFAPSQGDTNSPAV